MCYAFSDRISDVSHHSDGDTICARHIVSTSATESNPKTEPSTRKRAASTSLEHQPTKVAKHSINDKSTSTMAQAEAGENLSPDPANSKTLKEALKKAKLEIQVQGLALKELGDERNDWRLKAIEAEDEIRELNAKLSSRAMKDKVTGLDLSKRLENDIKEKYENKLKEQRKEHEDKVQQWKGKLQTRLKENQDTFNNKVKELKEKHQEQQDTKDQAHVKKVDELKAKDQKRQQEWKEFKSHQLQMQKDLRDEQQAKIKEAKPETNSIIKEKEKALKDGDKRIAQLEEIIEADRKRKKVLENEVNRLETKWKQLETDCNTKDAEKAGLQTSLDSGAHAFKMLEQGKFEMQGRYQEKLELEGRRWQVQYNKAEDLALKVVEQQRANFTLRTGHDRKDKRIMELEKKLGTGNGMTGLDVPSVSTASTQTDDVQMMDVSIST